MAAPWIDHLRDKVRAIDLDHLRQLEQFNDASASLLVSVLELFAREAPGHLVELRTAAERDDRVTVHHLAQTIGLSASGVGAHELARHCAELELLARDVRVRPGALEDAIARIKVTLAVVLLDVVKVRRAVLPASHE